MAESLRVSPLEAVAYPSKLKEIYQLFSRGEHWMFMYAPAPQHRQYTVDLRGSAASLP